MNKKKLPGKFACFLSIVLVCSMIVPQSVTVFAVEDTGDARVEMETDMTAGTECTDETGTASTSGDDAEMVTETAVTEEVEAIEERAQETEEMLAEEAVAAAEDTEEVLSGTCGENLSWTLADGTLTIIGTGAMEDYSYYFDVPWYDSRDRINIVIIYNGVTSIGNNAFAGYRSLTSIEIPDSVTKIGSSAFNDCTSLKQINIPESVTEIRDSAFEGCSSVTEITIPESVTSLRYAAFRNCSSLAKVVILGSMPKTQYGGDNFGVFCGCPKLTSAGPIGGDYAIQFGHMDQIPAAFFEDSAITSFVIPDGVTGIGGSAFRDCKSLSSVVIPDSVTWVEWGAFKGCSGLTSVGPIGGDYAIQFGWADKIPSGAFQYSCIVRAVIPDSVTVIGYNAFNDCSALESIIIPEGTSFEDDPSGNDLGMFNGCSRLLSAGPIGGDYNIQFGWSSRIPACAFWNSSITSVILPDGIEEIGDKAFQNCSAITNIQLPASVIQIGERAFRECSSLISITIPNRVNRIYYGTFKDCSSLTSITIPYSVTQIGDIAFEGCNALTDVYYGGSEEDWKAIRIGYDNEALKSANIHYNTQIGSIGDNLGWTLDSNGVLSINGIGKMADYDDSDFPAPWSNKREKIKSVRIGQFVTSIGASAFAGCTNLTQITIPFSVASIGASAFSGCDHLETVYYIGNKTQWSLIAVGTDNEPLKKAQISYRYSDTGGSDKTNMFIQTKQVSYYDTIHGVSNTMEIDWGWSMMESFGYNNKAAIAGLVLSGATESSQPNAEKAMKDLGFTSKDPKSKFYDKEWYEIAQPAVTFGYKHIIYDDDKDGHFFAVAVRGTDPSSAADLLTDAASLVGSFQIGAEFVYTELQSYMIECCGMSLEDIKKSGNVQFFVTGHSLGGAVANITAKKLIEEYGVPSVKAYTFAAPPCATVFDVIFAGDSYDIYNIVNDEDLVPKASWLINGLVKRNGTDMSFHREDDSNIYTRFNTITGGRDLRNLMTKWKVTDLISTKVDKTLTRKLCAHSPSVYMAYLANSVKSTHSGKRIVVRCPVDVEVYAEDEDGPFLVCRITDNKIDDTIPTGVYAYVEGDDKYIELLYDGDYTVKLTATDSGTMIYAVQNVNNEMNQVVDEKTYSNVALENGKKMTSSVSVWDKTDTTIDTENKVDTEDVQLFVIDSSGKPEKKVLPDGRGTEVPIEGSSDNDNKEYEGVLPEDIPADGRIPDGLWIAAVPDMTYTGRAVKPEVHIYDSTTRLTEKKDYTISYKNNVNAYTAAAMKVPTITVTGKGNYSGKETAVFHILPVTLDSESADVLDITLAAGTKVQKPVPVITVNGRKLAGKKDFTLEYPDQSADAYKSVGTYQIKVVGSGNYKGELTVPMTITDKKLMSKASVTKIKAQTYTGNPLTPKPVVKHGKDTLVEGTGYELEYRNNTEIGTATIIVKGIGDYCGQARVTFPITGGSVGKAKLSDAFKNQTEYTGAPIVQNCTLTAMPGQQAVTLREGTDYTVRYSNNTKAGKAAVVYIGKGAFTGTLKKTYTIVPYDIGADSQKKIKYDTSVISAYTKGGSKPVPTITFGEKKLKAGTDFILSYKNNRAVSDSGAQIIVKGKGNYKGSIMIPFRITTQDLSNLTLTAEDEIYQAGKANLYKTALKLTDADGKTLSAGKDYNKETIAYTYVNAVNLENGEQKNAGDEVMPADVIPAETELRVTVYAKEGSNYTGAVSAVYRIAKADLKKAKVTVNLQTYTGEQIKPGKDEIKVEIGKTTLSANDYDIVSYGTNVEKGTGTLTIKGKGSYGGTKTVPFKIRTKGFLWWNK